MSLKEQELSQTANSTADTSSIEARSDVKFLIYNRESEQKLEVNKDWTPEEEASARRKIDFFILPLLFFAFFILQIDRGNISNALTDTLMTDIGITTNQVNVGTALFNVGIVIFEIPSNIILQKVGPAKWLSSQVLIWSLIATVQSQIKNYGGFLVTRFFLGTFEAGFIPGALFYLSTWYTKKELTVRYTFYFLGNLAASASSGLIASGILKDVAGRNGNAGWKWIFIIEGVVGIIYGLIFGLLIPDSTTKSRPFWARTNKFNLLNERESYILTQRIIIDDPEKATNASKIGASDVIAAFSKPRIWAHFVLSLSSMIMSQALSTYTPLIIKALGYTKVEANARSSISGWMSIILMVIMTYTSNHFKPRGASIIFVLLWKLIFIITLRALPSTSTATTKFAILTVLNTSGAIAHVLNTSWLSLNCKTPVERSISLAIVVMAANIAGICGGQVLRTGDSPRHLNAFLALCIVSAFAFVWGIGMVIAYYVQNKKLDAESPRLDLENLQTEGLEIEEKKSSTVVVFVGKGDSQRDEQLLETLNGDYAVQDKELQALEGIKNFRYTP